MIAVGSKVLCRGVFADGFSLVGIVETVYDDGMCCVRLTNGNVRWFAAERVKLA